MRESIHTYYTELISTIIPVRKNQLYIIIKDGSVQIIIYVSNGSPLLVSQFINIGFTDLIQLKNMGFSACEVMSANIYTLHELKRAGYKVKYCIR